MAADDLAAVDYPQRAGQLAATLLAGCEAVGIRLVLAESLTGGLLADAIAAVPGASKVLLGGVVAYDNAVKVQVLGVADQLISDFGAVSSQAAAAMAEGARGLVAINSGQSVAIATTGVAGPDLQEGKPVGQVFVAVATADGTSVQAFQFYGDRTQIRQQAVIAALQFALEEISA